MEKEQSKARENKMGTLPVNRLLIEMSVPMMISMLVQACYNIVDSIFVAKIDEYALTAVSLVFPVQSLAIAVAAGTGVGVNALLSKRLGEKRFEEADQTANTAIVIAGLEYLIFLVIGTFFSETFFAVQTDIPEIIAYGKSYMSICMMFSMGMFGQFCFERLLQATGKTVYSMITQMTGAVINLILDPVLIFGLIGFPKLGIAGAAIATVTGQIIAMFVALYLNLHVNKELHFSWKKLRLKKEVLKPVFIVGVPSILMQSIGSVMVFLMNKILMGFTSTATAVFGVYFKLQSFIFMPVFGLNNGLIPIVAYNYGAGHKDRIKKTMKLGMIYAVTIMLIGLIVAELIPGTLLKMFNASDKLLEIGIPAIRIICSHFVIAGFSIVASGVFQGLGKSVYSLIVSVTRQLVVLIPVAFLLSLTGILDLVWLSFPIAELVSLMITLICLRRVMRHLDEVLA
ncbi:MAG: MATE family efflux transporter [Lachnospiraceae bacterium]|nr:MATE family efflux transporter [Lachnospiraceae bacterium]